MRCKACDKHCQWSDLVCTACTSAFCVWALRADSHRRVAFRAELIDFNDADTCVAFDEWLESRKSQPDL